MTQPMMSQMTQPMMGQPMNRNFGNRARFYPQPKRDKSSSTCRACGLQGHWAGDRECSLNVLAANTAQKAITYENELLNQFNTFNS